jgi:negative regulator of sigma E activity
MTHKFAVGQTVTFTPVVGEVVASRFPVVATVMRLLPRDGIEYQYHIQVVTDGLLRRAQESQLQPT